MFHIYSFIHSFNASILTTTAIHLYEQLPFRPPSNDTPFIKMCVLCARPVTSGTIKPSDGSCQMASQHSEHDSPLMIHLAGCGNESPESEDTGGAEEADEQDSNN